MTIAPKETWALFLLWRWAVEANQMHSASRIDTSRDTSACRLPPRRLDGGLQAHYRHTEIHRANTQRLLRPKWRPDTAIASSVGDTYGANLSPMEQLKQCVMLFQPIKDKILCITHGNHENRIYKQDGLDITHLMAAQLGIEERYSPTTALLFYPSWQRPEAHQAHLLHRLCHAWSRGGRREGGKINRLADLAGIVDADIYIHAHTHFPAVFKEGFFRTDVVNSTAVMVDKLFVNTAASLNYGGYGDVQGYRPSSLDNPTIYLDGRKKRVTARL